jgi:hypothetical protein
LKEILWIDLLNTKINKTIVKIMETYPSKTLKINVSLIVEEKKLLVVLKKHTATFLWD